MLDRFDVRCEPPRWARGAHAQTLLGHFLPCPGPPVEPGTLGVHRRLVELGDGDRLCVFDGEPLTLDTRDGREGGAPLAGVVVHLFHGLTGSTESNYVRLVAAIARGAGARVVACNHRGQGPGAGLASGIYHSGSAPDAWASIAAARELHPGDVHVAVGFSLSGNLLLLGAGRDGDAPGAPDAVLAVNPPVDLSAAVQRIERGVNRLYDTNFVRGMRRAMAERIRRGEVDARFRVAPHWTVRRADDLVTAPLAGFENGAQYYERCSAGPWLAGVRVPAAVLTSADDPFIDPREVEEAVRGTDVALHVEEFGGHLGYLHVASVVESGPASIAGRRWLGAAVLHYTLELARAARRDPLRRGRLADVVVDQAAS